MNALTRSPAAPHTHAGDNIPRIMFTVLLALIPATAYGLYMFGWPAINLFVLTVTSAVAGEAICLYIADKPVLPALGDGSAILTGWLLASSLPPWAPWWIGVSGGLFAIIIGKQIFGGIGQNVFNPAMLARVALLISVPVQMTSWVTPAPIHAVSSPDFLQGLAITFGIDPIADGASGATLLNQIKTGLSQGYALGRILPGEYSLLKTLAGNQSGSLGETSAVLLFIGGVVLLLRKIISWHIPVSMLAAVMIPATLFNLLEPEHYAGPLLYLTSGGLVLGAFFIATDLVTSPTTYHGQLLFGAGCGLLVYVIRTWGGYPEGVAFAVLLMNAVTPLIDHYLRPRAYGRGINGRSLGGHHG